MRSRVYETDERPSLRPSVCPIDRQQQLRAVGLLLSAPRPADIDRQQAPALSSNGAAARGHSTAISSKCGQCHVDNRGTTLNADS